MIELSQAEDMLDSIDTDHLIEEARKRGYAMFGTDYEIIEAVKERGLLSQIDTDHLIDAAKDNGYNPINDVSEDEIKAAYENIYPCWDEVINIAARIAFGKIPIFSLLNEVWELRNEFQKQSFYSEIDIRQ